jgi:hypothetical protein
VVEASENLLYLNSVFLKVLDFLGREMVLFVTVTQCTAFLGVHPVEHACLSSISPGVDTAIVSEGD